SGGCVHIGLHFKQQHICRHSFCRHSFALSPNGFFARYSFIPALSELRAQGMPGARCAHGLVCNGSGRAHTSIQVTPESPGIPHAMVLTATPCSPRCSGFLATVTPEKLASQELDTSVEVSGPHVFARPRKIAVRYRRIRVHRIPSRGRDDRDSPLFRDGTVANIAVICISEKQNI